MNYERENAKEWAGSEADTFVEAKKTKPAVVAAPKSPLSSWSQVAAANTKKAPGQPQSVARPAPAGARPVRQQPSYSGAAAGRGRGRGAPAQSRSGNALPGRSAAPTPAALQQSGPSNWPAPGQPDYQIKNSPAQHTVPTRAQPGVQTRQPPAPKPFQAPHLNNTWQDNDPSAPQVAQRVDRPRVGGVAAFPNTRPATQRIGGSRKVKDEARFPKVKPENDWFGKDAKRRQREEDKSFEAIKKHGAALGDPDHGHRGVFLLGDTLAADPYTFVQRLGIFAHSTKARVDLNRQSSTVGIVAPEVAAVQLILSAARNMSRSPSDTQEQSAIILVDPPAYGLDLGATTVKMVSALEPGALPKAAGLRLPLNLLKKYPVLLNASSQKADELVTLRRQRRNTFALQFAATKALGSLRQYKGSVTMRINFGALVFQRYMWNPEWESRPTDSFIESLKHANVRADLYKLAPEARLFHRVEKAHELLAPYRGGTVEGTLPSFTGCFVWMTGDKTDRIYEVTTDVITNTKRCPGVSQRGWMPPNAPGTHRPLSVYLTQMNGGISCALQVHTEDVFVQPKDTPLELTAQVTTPLRQDDYGKAAARGTLMFDWRRSGCADFRQRTVWKWRVKADEGYILELVRYDRFEMNRARPNLNTAPTETRWDACVYHDTWAEKFAANISIKHGEKCYWDADIEAFFPTEHADAEKEPGTPAGFALLMRWIRDFLDSLNAEEQEAISREQ